METEEDEKVRSGTEPDKGKGKATADPLQLGVNPRPFDGFVRMHERAVIRQMKTLGYRRYKSEMAFLSRAHLALKTRRGRGRGDTKPRPKLRR